MSAYNAPAGAMYERPSLGTSKTTFFVVLDLYEHTAHGSVWRIAYVLDKGLTTFGRDTSWDLDSRRLG